MPSIVTPAEALHRMVYRAEAGVRTSLNNWIPAFAGMTENPLWDFLPVHHFYTSRIRFVW